MRKTTQTPKPPYYAVIFTSVRTSGDNGYAETAAQMLELAKSQEGFLGVESARDENLGITVSYWSSLEDIEAWKQNVEHLEAQRKGQAEWYQEYHLRVSRVARVSDFSQE